MAQKTNETENTTQKTEAKAVDYVAQIGGNLHLANAKTIFGSNAVKAIQAVAQAGGYGEHNTDTIEYEFFGGLQMPRDGDSKTVEQRVAINAALNNL